VPAPSSRAIGNWCACVTHVYTVRPLRAQWELVLSVRISGILASQAAPRRGSTNDSSRQKRSGGRLHAELAWLASVVVTGGQVPDDGACAGQQQVAAAPGAERDCGVQTTPRTQHTASPQPRRDMAPVCCRPSARPSVGPSVSVSGTKTDSGVPCT